MTFLNPLVLFGLVAAAIPIILHLLNLRKLRTIEFSSLQFLRELQKTRMRRVKIRQILLLVLRTLLITALVLAFSRPAVRTSLAGIAGGHAASTMVILLDDSPSMGVHNERGVLFQQAKDAAAQIAALAQDGDLIYLVRLSEIRHTSDFSSARTKEALLAALNPLTVSQETFPFRAAVAAAARLFARSAHANSELYLISDLQATQLAAPAGAPDTTGFPLDPQVRLFLVQVPADGKLDNVGIGPVTVPTRMITQQRPVQVEAGIRNFGASSQHGSLVSLYLDGARVVQKTLDIPSEGSTRAVLVASPRRRGILNGAVEIEDDALEIDNRRFFALNVPENIRVLLVGAGPSDTRLPALALTLGGDTTMTGLFSVRQALEPGLAAADVNAFDVVVLCGMRRFSPAETDRLVQFTRNGGGVLLFPGSEADLANYNATLFARLGIPPAAPAPAADRRSTSFLSFARVDLAHPLFAGMFEQAAGRRRTDGQVESPRIYRAITPQTGSSGAAIISLSNGAGFLTEYQAGKGRLLLCSVEAGLTWSDFPVKGLFAPLMHRAMVYLAEQEQTAPAFIAGEKLTFDARVRNHAATGPFILRTPSGSEERIVPVTFSSSGTARFELAASPETGIYELRMPGGREAKNGGPVLQAVAVNVAPSESDLRRADNEELRRFWNDMGIDPARIRTVTPGQTMDASVQESRYGLELWKHFLTLALVLAVLEMAVGREAKQEQL